MIDPTVTNNKGVENAEKNLEQAKHRLATEKKKANDARRRIENRHKYMMVALFINTSLSVLALKRMK